MIRSSGRRSKVQLTAIDGIVLGWQSYLGNLAVIKGGGLERFWRETDSLHRGGAQQLAEKLRDSWLNRPGGQQLKLSTPVKRMLGEAGQGDRDASEG